MPPHLLVLFGATGDLVHRMILPALFHQIQDGKLPAETYVLGVARGDISEDAYRDEARTTLLESGYDEEAVDDWVERCVSYNGLGKEDKDYAGLRKHIEQVEEEAGLPGNRAFYLSIPPQAYASTIEGLGEQGLNESDGWTRLVVEKPFGHDLESAQELNKVVHRYFDEEQVYRIDHFLGKETVQNLLAFRFANLMFASIWSRDQIERVEITASETLGLEGRVGFYDEAGALRDMVQNHLTQMLLFTAMEPPSAFTPRALLREKVKVLESTRPIDPQRDVVFGQYTSGEVEGEKVPGYEEELGDRSDTETFAAVRLHIDNMRWQGVPFFLRTGKRMKVTQTQIAVHFRCVPASIFQPHGTECGVQSNVLLITLKPDEGFTLRFQVKTPGQPFQLETENFRFRYEEAFGDLPDAYETLLLDIVEGDQTLFVQADETEAAWALFTPVLEDRPEVHDYKAGSWGPDAARDLLASWDTGDEG